MFAFPLALKGVVHLRRLECHDFNYSNLYCWGEMKWNSPGCTCQDILGEASGRNGMHVGRLVKINYFESRSLINGIRFFILRYFEREGETQSATVHNLQNVGSMNFRCTVTLLLSRTTTLWQVPSSHLSCPWLKKGGVGHWWLTQ